MTRNKTTHFGNQIIDEEQKSGRVQGVFNSVASKYDVMNDVMSLGIHRAWKNTFIDQIDPRPGQRLLDVAGGTGDIAFRFLERAGDGATATIVDLTEQMLIEGRKRAQAQAFAQQMQWLAGDAMALPFANHSFDRYTISFGLRNVTRIPDALSEAYRVLDYGGRILILEFSQLPDETLQWLYDRYSYNFIPTMGQLIANDRDSYQYLVESIRKFPPQEQLAQMMRDAGFSSVSYKNLSFGIVAIHSGWKT